MANVLFKKGLLKNLPSTKVEGTIYVTTDERAMYLDVDKDTRIRLGDFNEIPNLNALPDVSHEGGTPNPTGLYYSIAENVLARYDSENRKWAQINPDNWFEIQSFAQSLSSTKDSSNVTTITVGTTLIQKNEVGQEAASGDGASQWSNYLNFKDDGKVVTITKEGNDTIKISAKDEKVTSAANHYKYDASRDGPAVAATSTTDTNTGNTFITGVSVDKAGHVVGVKSREAVIDLVTNPTLTSSEIEPDDSKNTAASIDFSITHGNTHPEANLKVEGAGATTVATSNGGKTLKISSTDQTVEYGHHYNPAGHESSSDKITVGSGKVLSEIKRDNAGHVIGVTERDENKLSTVSMTSSGSLNNVILTTQVNDSLASPSGEIKITGSGDAAVTAVVEETNGKKNYSINIETHDTKVTHVDNHYKALKDGKTDTSKPENFIHAGTYKASDITNATKTNALAETPVITGVTIDAAGHVTGIKAVKIADTHNKLTDNGTASVAPEHGNGWIFELQDTDNHINSTTFDPTIKYGKNTEGATTQTVHGVDGSFTLDTYTTGEVDAKITTAIQATGAMVLKGEARKTSKDNPAITLPTNASAGDTYIVTEDGATFGDIVCEAGDLLVSKIDNPTSTNKDNWYYVPSGNDKHIIIQTKDDTAKTVGVVLADGNQVANVKYGSINFNSDASASGSLIKAEKFVDSANGDGAQDVRFVFSMEWGNF